MSKKIFKLIDDNLLFALSLFLLIFIPLYPKIPLFDALPGYNVRIRLDDFFVALSAIIWIIYLFRGKVKLSKTPIFIPVLTYLVVGFLSTLSAIFITHTVTSESYQIFKIFLHYFRRIEYMFLYFLFFSAIKNRRQIIAYLSALIVTVFTITIYGFGQKYLLWPAFSTMNREFAKGIKLYLTEHSRVLSTFGGHYDLAAYIMIVLPIIVILFFIIKNKFLKFILIILSFAQFWLLILTASRTSFVAFLATVSVVFIIMAFKKGWVWSSINLSSVIFVSFFIMLSFGPLSERFAQIIKLNKLRDTVNKSIEHPPVNGIILTEQIPLDDQLSIVATPSDVPPTPVKPIKNGSHAVIYKDGKKPADVYVEPYLNADEAIKNGEATSASEIKVSYSENALSYGLSTGIRLDALWPRAIAGFKRNPLLGSGYSTLTKEKVWEQTTAESTDNDFLRMLGETGLLGFFTYMWILIVLVEVMFLGFKKTKYLLFASLYASGIGMIAGIILTAVYIDIFEASKVAYTLWSLSGIITGYAVMEYSGKLKIKSNKFFDK